MPLETPRTPRFSAAWSLFALVALFAGPATAGSTLVGQFACSECWHEADRATVPYGGAADQACAARCAADGVPPAIATRGDDGRFSLTIVRGGAPRPHDSWLDLIGAFVRAETEPADGGVRVTSIVRLDASPWLASAADDAPPAAADGTSWPDLTGAPQSLAALRGRVTVVNFWATWCAPCIEEMPALSAIQADYAPLGVQVVGIAADDRQASGVVLEFAREAGVAFPVWLGATTDDMAALGVGPALPATVVLDREGAVVHRVSGIFDDAELRAAIDAALRAADTGRAPDEAAPLAAGAARRHRLGHRHRDRAGEAALVPS